MTFAKTFPRGLAAVAVGFILCLLLLGPPLRAERAPAIASVLVTTAPVAPSVLSNASLQEPEPPPVPRDVTALWLAAVGAIGSLILGAVKFFTGNLAKAPDWLKGVIMLVLPSVLAFGAKLVGIDALPPDLLHAVPLVAAGLLGMGLRAIVKAVLPGVSAATANA